MSGSRRLALGIVLAGFAAVAGPHTPSALAFDAKKADQSVVRVLVLEVKNGRRTGQYSSGTGFVVADGYVVTNEHVTDDSDYRKDGATAERVVVDGSRANQRPAQLVWSAPELDLAVLRGCRRPATCSVPSAARSARWAPRSWSSRSRS